MVKKITNGIITIVEYNYIYKVFYGLFPSKPTENRYWVLHKPVSIENVLFDEAKMKCVITLAGNTPVKYGTHKKRSPWEVDFCVPKTDSHVND